tara:strand:- start:179 stop:1420 length:1242 start_codon:yes stop_codon:yes gene_type:complete
MARKFIGSNTDPSSKSTWYYRAKFEVKAYDQPNAGENEIKDITFFERQYYGTIDNQDYSITPKEDKIVMTVNSKRVLNFVDDAFRIMKKRMTVAVEYNKITRSSPYFVNFNPVQAYRPPNSDYRVVLQNILMKYNTKDIPSLIGLKNITSFDDYVKNFIKIISTGVTTGYYTQTKWCRSPSASVFNSGLAISISNLNKGDDQKKIDDFIDHPDFDYYLKLALNSGFSISKDAPWILVFDLASPAAEPFLSPYGIRNLNDLFSKYYNRTELNDIIILRNILYKYYNNFIVQYRINRTNRSNCKKSYTEYFKREPLTIERLDNEYPEEWFLDYYIDIRNTEEGTPYNEQSLRSIKKIAKNYYKTLDRSSALSYIASRFVIQTWSKPYGYDDTLDKLSKAESLQLQAKRRKTSGGY